MKTLVIAVYGNRMCRAFADAVAAHGEVAGRRVDATVLAEKISHPFVVSGSDNGVEADEEGKGQAAVLGPLHVGAPGGLLGELVTIADQREAGWAG